MSKTKAGGSSKNGRDSNAQRLGPKVFDGQAVTAGCDSRPSARHRVSTPATTSGREATTPCSLFAPGR